MERHPLSGLQPVLSLDEVNVVREAAHSVYIDPLLSRWAIRLVRATREAEGVAIGASVRGSLALERSARAWALLSGREFVTPVDIERLFLPSSCTASSSRRATSRRPARWAGNRRRTGSGPSASSSRRRPAWS